MSKAQTAANMANTVSSYANSISAYISPLLPTSMSGAAGGSPQLGSAAAAANSTIMGSMAPLTSSAPEVHFSRDLDRLYHKKVRPLLDAVDELRGLLAGEPIRLPTIVVVGDQSSGKSSVLEALSGVSLPRGQNITTRCPLVLRLINNATKDNNAESASAPYAIIGLNAVPTPNDEKISNLDFVGKCIEEYTIKLAGKSTGVSSQPIYLSVYRANSPDLTLIDLPGITRNPIGDQPRDIYQQIRSMIYQYIRPEESVILNVMPATVDFPTCECIMMAKEVDPQGIRTIGVVSKLDLAERGIKKKLEIGVEQLGLRLGVIGVRNRTNEENLDGISWESARENENSFFRNHKELNFLFENEFNSMKNELNNPMNSTNNNSSGSNELYLGTTNLAKLLTYIQEQKIRYLLPKIKLSIKELLLNTKEKLKLFPISCQSPSECRLRFDQLLNSFYNSISLLCRGDHFAIANGNNKLHLSPRLSEYYTNYSNSLSTQSSKYLSQSYAREVEEEIKENNGITLPNFLSQNVFKSLINKELIKYSEPSKLLIESIKQLLLYILNYYIQIQFNSYPLLLSRLNSLILVYLNEKSKISLSRLTELLESEEEVFTLNSYYMDLTNKLKGILYDRLYGINSTQLKQYQLQQIQQMNAKPSKAASLFSGLAASAMGASNNNTNDSSNSSPCPTHPHVLNTSINDLNLSIDLVNLTLPFQSQSISGTNSSSNTVLDMQINCFSYSQILQKRLSDSVPLICRYHFIRSLSNYNDGGLHSFLQAAFAEVSDKELQEAMKEEREIANKREKLVQSVVRLEKALQVFDRL